MTRDNPPALPWRQARRAERLEPSVMREILKVTERTGVLPVAGGVPAPALQVLISSDSQQGLGPVGKGLVDAGSRVAVESPTCLGTLRARAPYEPELQALDCDGQGPLPQAVETLGGVLRAALERRP